MKNLLLYVTLLLCTSVIYFIIVVFYFFSITDFELFDYDVPWYSFRNVYLCVGYGWMIFTFLESVGM